MGVIQLGCIINAEIQMPPGPEERAEGKFRTCLITDEGEIVGDLSAVLHNVLPARINLMKLKKWKTIWDRHWHGLRNHVNKKIYIKCSILSPIKQYIATQMTQQDDDALPTCLQGLDIFPVTRWIMWLEISAEQI